jgi:hypothetical protein
VKLYNKYAQTTFELFVSDFILVYLLERKRQNYVEKIDFVTEGQTCCEKLTMVPESEKVVGPHNF